MLNNQMVTIQYEDSFSPVDVWLMEFGALRSLTTQCKLQG